jgi:sugar phosphate permease
VPPAVSRDRDSAVSRTAGKGWLVWGIGAGVYLLAVFHRTSLGVAGPMAADRLGLTAAQLASFVMLQLGLYAAMQVPTGIMVDRFGPRRMLLAATLTMGTAQLLFSVVHSYPLALLARGLLGVGDAMTYVSVLRLVAGWFPARQYAVITALTGLIGALGNLAATLPLTGLLHSVGWGPTFGVAGALSLGYALLLLRKASVAPFRDVDDTGALSVVGGRRVRTEIATAWRMPAGRLGFWIHLTTMSAPVVFGTLWGYPYLVQGLGYSPARASTLMMTMVFVGLTATLTLGVVIGRRPAVRTPIAIGVTVACLLGWLALVGWPDGYPPAAVVVAAVVAFAAGGPASAVGFMLARDYNPRHRISTATGMVNVGGFLGAVIGLFLTGQIIDVVSPTGTPTLAGFRWAFAALSLLTAVGLWRLITWWLRARAVVLADAAKGRPVPVRLVRRRFDRVPAPDPVPARTGRSAGR